MLRKNILAAFVMYYTPANIREKIKVESFPKKSVRMSDYRFKYPFTFRANVFFFILISLRKLKKR